MMHQSRSLATDRVQSSSGCSCSHRQLYSRPTPHYRALHIAARAATVQDRPSTSKDGVEAAKEALVRAADTTGRGIRVDTFRRAELEELQVAVENYGGASLDYALLPGKWRLIYTTATDVLPILEAEYRFATPFGPSPIRVGNIYQRFTAPEEGVVENIIELGLPLLEGRDGITFTVGASYEVRSPHRIALVFEEARVGGVRVSPMLEALLAPALLPRGSLQHQLLLAIKLFQIKIPFRSAQQLATSVAGAASRASGSSPQRLAAGYQLSFLDEEMLIGRATALGGSFIFLREGSPPNAEHKV